MERLIIAIIYSAFEQVSLPEYAELYKCLHYYYYPMQGLWIMHILFLHNITIIVYMHTIIDYCLKNRPP